MPELGLARRPADLKGTFTCLFTPHPNAATMVWSWAPLTGWPEPGLEQKMVYLRMTPLGLVGGSQDTTTLLADEGTALIPAGGPGTEE